MGKQFHNVFKQIAANGKRCSLRYSQTTTESLTMQRGVLLPVSHDIDAGVMITVYDGNGYGYAATSDLSDAGILKAYDEASAWAAQSKDKTVFDFSSYALSSEVATYEGPHGDPWISLSLKDKIGLLTEATEAMKIDDRIVNWSGGFAMISEEHLLLTTEGGAIEQRLQYVIPSMQAVAHGEGDTQKRSLGARSFNQQGGLEHLARVGFKDAGRGLSEEALELLTAPNCPEGVMDLILDPDQMVLQIHESIGHPLEMDRILGDERNYAGTSFVTEDMFGNFQYGSEILNVSFDPTHEEEIASYGFDDEGDKAEKVMIIEKGQLLAPEGSRLSALRSNMPGLANNRACNWNRPPMDRMGNLNLEPGQSSFEQMVKSIERGVYMKTNTSWSIDNSRNKFQFGCEWAQLIENGELTTVVKNPNYRGISREFWRNLKMVGNEDSFTIMGTPNCGKGEPNQMIRTGHASPVCLFSDIEVFGGEL